MPDLQLGGGTVVRVVPPEPTITMAPPAGPEIIVVPVAGPRGLTGPAGPGNNWLSDQVPAETPDSSRTTFTTSVPYTTGTLRVYLNGLRESHFAEVTATTFAFEDAPWPGDSIRLDFLPTP